MREGEGWEREGRDTESKYVVSRDPLLIHHVILRMRSANFSGEIACILFLPFRPTCHTT